LDSLLTAATKRSTTVWMAWVERFSALLTQWVPITNRSASLQGFKVAKDEGFVSIHFEMHGFVGKIIREYADSLLLSPQGLCLQLLRLHLPSQRCWLSEGGSHFFCGVRRQAPLRTCLSLHIVAFHLFTLLFIRETSRWY
jgi:hypothetical protein